MNPYYPEEFFKNVMHIEHKVLEITILMIFEVFLGLVINVTSRFLLILEVIF